MVLPGWRGIWKSSDCAEPLSAKLGYFITVEDPFGPVGWEILAGTAANGFSDSPGFEILEVSRAARFRSFPNQLTFKLGRGSQHVEQKFGRWISIVRIESLGCGDESDAMRIQLPKVCQTIEQ